MSGKSYFLMTRDHLILEEFEDLSSARNALHRISSAQYVARMDGAVMAFMSHVGHPWRVISKVPIEFRRAFLSYGKRAKKA